MEKSPLAHQSLGRDLTDAERELAQALEAIYAEGIHDFDAVAKELNTRELARPSGDPSPWDRDGLEQELRAINRALDEAYAKNGIGA